MVAIEYILETARQKVQTQNPPAGPDIQTLKAKMKTTWESGNWDYFARFMESSSVEFFDRLSPAPGTEMLDVACGSGALCMMAARHGLKVTGIDLAENNIDAARGRSRMEGLTVRFDQGDAEQLPYADASFDLVTSIFGAMFAPRPELAAAELLRVCRPGGKIAMGNWTPTGFIGKMFKLVSSAMPPTGAPSPVLWGVPETAEERLASGTAHINTKPVIYRFSYPFPPAEVTEFFRENFGPLNRAHAALPTDQWKELEAKFTELWASHNVSTDPNYTEVDAEYLHVEAIKQPGTNRENQ